MRILLATLLSALPLLSYAFTQGTLLPGYLCGPAGDGYPKSVGTLIPKLILGTPGNDYNEFPPGPGNKPIKWIGMDGVNISVDAVAPSSQQIIGAFHNGDPNQGYTVALKNPVFLVPSKANINTGVADYTITPGKEHNFALVANDSVNGVGFNPAGVALDGAFIYAMDTKTGKRIGAWKNAGPNFSPWSACNLNFSYSMSVGIVHNNLLSEAPSISGLIWVAPDKIEGTVKFIGAAVTDVGYGPFTTEYNTTTNKTAPSIFAQGIRGNFDAANGGGPAFTPVDQAPDFPWNAPITPLNLQTGPATADPGMVLMSIAAVAAIGVGCGLVGIGVGALVISAIKPKKGKEDSMNTPMMKQQMI